MREERRELVKAYLSPEVHNALLAKKAETGKSISQLVEEAVQRQFMRPDSAEMWPEFRYLFYRLEELSRLSLFHVQLTLYWLAIQKTRRWGLSKDVPPEKLAALKELLQLFKKWALVDFSKCVIEDEDEVRFNFEERYPVSFVAEGEEEKKLLGRMKELMKELEG